MRLPDAIEMLADSGVDALGPTTWADLGCGDGTFTLALASLLAPGSTIHAMDRDAAALRTIASEHHGVRIKRHREDFTNLAWPFDALSGILMANSLHYVEDQAAFLRGCAARMVVPRRFLIVEVRHGQRQPLGALSSEPDTIAHAVPGCRLLDQDLAIPPVGLPEGGALQRRDRASMPRDGMTTRFDAIQPPKADA